MAKSMTGFGRIAVQDSGWTQTWEIRSVNGRHLDLRWRMPWSLRCLEADWERIVREQAGRGRLEVSLQLHVSRPDLLGATLNTVQAGAMLDQLEAFAQERQTVLAPDINRLLNISSLWEDDSGEPDKELAQSLEQGLRAALDDWNSSRAKEGAATIADLSSRFENLESLLARIKERIPQVKDDKIEQLRSRIQNTLETYAIDLDPNRLLQEVAVLTDKLDVSEELSRLGAHLGRLRQIAKNGGELGKRLDFTLQECFREINTCGNKAQDSQISELVVDFKVELEKCREQVQNLE